MDLIKRFLGAAEKPLAPAARPPQLERHSEFRAPDLDTRTTTRRELLRVLTRDTQRFAGIPEAWIESQVLLEPGQDGRTLMHLRLVLKHWDAQFLQYLVAFQRRLMGEIERFEPDAREWVASINWQLPLEDQCPHLELPDTATWGGRAAMHPPAAAVVVPVPRTAEELEQDAVEQDLAKFFAVRDAHMEDADAGDAAQAKNSGARK